MIIMSFCYTLTDDFGKSYIAKTKHYRYCIIVTVTRDIFKIVFYTEQGTTISSANLTS